MIIKSAIFLESNTSYRKCPAPIHPEFAFIGRSNVGKSSLINMLAGQKKLALTSGKPGKTQTINHFLINKNLYFADLPGYGYAKVSKSARASWEKMIRDYLIFRENLISTFVLADIRHEPQKQDLEFMNWLGSSEIPFAIIFTKSDKLKKQELAGSLEKYLNGLGEYWEELPPYFISSAVKGYGKEEILEYISIHSSIRSS